MLTGQHIVDGLASDPNLTLHRRCMRLFMPKKARRVALHFVHGVPALLGAQLEAVVTPYSLLKAQHTVIAAFWHGGYESAMLFEWFGAMPKRFHPLAAELLGPIVKQSVETLDRLMDEAAANGNELTPLGEAYVHRTIGSFRDVVCEEFDTGTLTIGRLLELQPDAVLLNVP